MRSTKVIQPHGWKEARRFQALALSNRGWKQCQIAEALGVTPGAVSQWLKQARLHGAESLGYHPIPGRQPKLPPEQKAQLPLLLARGTEAFGFRGDVWTTRRVATVIEREYGVRYHPAHVSRLLREVGWTPQKPIRRATQRDEAAIAAWYAERWPAIKKKPLRKTAPLSG
jgi:transposase